MDKEEYENIWMSRKYSRTYSSSESSLEYVICHASQDESTQKQPWSEGMEALSNLPGGDIALSLIPTLHGDALQKVLEEFQCVTFNKNEDRKHSISLSTSADEIEQKTILVDENRAAAVTPVQLLAEWPDTCLLIASWLNHVEIVKALLEKIVPVSTSDNDGRTPLHLPASTTSTKIEEKQLKHGNFEGSLCCGSSESRLDTRNSAQDCKNKRSDIMSEGEYENISLSRIIHPRTCSSSESRLDTRNRVQDTDCKNKRSDIMSEEEYENIWFNRIVHPRTCSSSEGNLESVICHASQDESTQKQPWSEEMKALSNLPGGDRALSLIPTLHGDALQKVQEKFQCATSDKNEDQHISLLISDDLCERDFLNKDTSGYGIDTIDYVPTVKYFIKSRADMENARKSALYYAVLNNAVYCVEALLQAGACPNNSQVHTATPLHVAATLGNVHCIKLLLDHNADVTIEMGTTKLTPLLLTAEKGNAECTKLLLVAGASTETRNSSGQTAMHLATLAQSVETIKELIRFGAKVDEEDNEGRIPLHAAVARTLRSSEIVKILIQAGASINKADKFGYTPLHIAALNENSHSVMILLSKGGDVTARTKGGVTALSFIIRRTPNVFSRFVTHLNQAI